MSGAPAKEIIDIEVTLVHETDLAILVKNSRGNKVWLPKSMIEYTPSNPSKNRYWVTLPVALAEEKELDLDN